MIVGQKQPQTLKYDSCQTDLMNIMFYSTGSGFKNNETLPVLEDASVQLYRLFHRLTSTRSH